MLTKVKTAVLVSGGGTNLQAILDSRGSVIESAEITLVVSSSPTAYALERAKKHGIEGLCIRDEEALQQALAERGIELIILAGYLKILSAEFTRRWDKRILNVHPSLIPSFCGEGMYGLLVHEAALKKGVKVTGATVHFVNEIPDGGEIIAQKAVEVREGDTPSVLQRRVMEEAEWVILPRAVEKIAKELRNAGLA